MVLGVHLKNKKKIQKMKIREFVRNPITRGGGAAVHS